MLYLRFDVLSLESTRAFLAHPATAIVAAGPALLSAGLDGFALAAHARPLHFAARVDLGVAIVVTAALAIALVLTAPSESVRVPRAERPVVVLRVIACVLAVLLLAISAWVRPAGDPTLGAVLLCALGGLGTLLALRVTVLST